MPDMNISLFIGQMETGGAERQMAVIAKGLALRGHTVQLLTLFAHGSLASDINANASVKLISLWSRKSRGKIARILQLIAAPFILRKYIKESDCMYSMLEATNFISWLATRRLKHCHVVWGIRSSKMQKHWKMLSNNWIKTWVSTSKAVPNRPS